MDCIFCKIINREIPSTIVYEDERVLAFKDIAPQAPVHILVISKEHISSAAALNKDNSAIVAKIFEVIASKIAVGKEFEGGYRIVSNVGENAGQTVKHLHFHVMAGKRLSEMMS